MADRIELRGLRVAAFCGVLAEEQARRQPFDVDVDLELDLRAAGRTDNLADTVDYGFLCASIHDAVTTERYALLERMAQRIAEIALGDPRVTGTRVTIRKLRPPVAELLDTSGVSIYRAR